MRALVHGRRRFPWRTVAAALREAGVEVPESAGRIPGPIRIEWGSGPAPWPRRRLAGVRQGPAGRRLSPCGARRMDEEAREINVGLCRRPVERAKAPDSGDHRRQRQRRRYGDALDRWRGDQPEPGSPRGRASAYGASKLARGRGLSGFFPQETAPAADCARIFTAIGPGMPAHLALGQFRPIGSTSFTGKSGDLAPSDVDSSAPTSSPATPSPALVGLALHPEANGVFNVFTANDRGPQAARCDHRRIGQGDSASRRPRPACGPAAPGLIYGDQAGDSSVLGMKTFRGEYRGGSPVGRSSSRSRLTAA